MSEQNQVAGKMHQHPLAASFHGIYRAAGERCVVIDARQFGKDRLETGDRLSGKRTVKRSRRLAAVFQTI